MKTALRFRNIRLNIARSILINIEAAVRIQQIGDKDEEISGIGI